MGGIRFVNFKKLSKRLNFIKLLDFKGSETLGNLLISLLFIWGNYICATGVFEKEKQFSFKMIKYLLINWNFSFASVFSPNLIFGITDDKEKGGFIVHFNDLHDGDVTPKILNEITKFPIKIELNFQKNIFWNSYHDSLCLSSVLKKKNLLFFVEDKNLLKTIHVLNWEHPVKILHKSQNFINAMKLIIDLYKGSVRNYSDISNNQIIKRKSLKRLIEEITQEYIKKYYDTFWSSEAIEKAKFMNNSSNRDESFMLMVIEFLVETEQYEYLFQKIYQDFEKMHRQTQFLECLEPFIFAQKIK